MEQQWLASNVMVPAQVKRLRRYVSQNEIVRSHLSLKQPSNAAPSGAEVEDDRIIFNVRSDLPREWDDFLDRGAATAPDVQLLYAVFGESGTALDRAIHRLQYGFKPLV